MDAQLVEQIRKDKKHVKGEPQSGFALGGPEEMHFVKSVAQTSRFYMHAELLIGEIKIAYGVEPVTNRSERRLRFFLCCLKMPISARKRLG